MNIKLWILRRDWFNIMGYAAIIGLWADATAWYYHAVSTMFGMKDFFQDSLYYLRLSEAFRTASDFYGWISVVALAVVIYKSVLKWQIKNIVKKYQIDTI